MDRRTRYGLVGLLLLAPATVAWAGSGNGLTLQPQSRLWVSGTSTVRSFECKAASFDVRVATRSPDGVSAVLSGEKAVTTVELTVPARNLDCANGTMNEHMLKALKAQEHPEISFRLSTYELARGAEGMRVTMTGTLKMGGTQKPVTLVADAKDAGGGLLRVTGTHELVMTEFGLKPPTLMMGTMKVGERVRVGFDLLLKG